MRFSHPLPTPRGPLSESLFTRLASRRGPLARAQMCDPADDDAQLALHCIHELSYRGLSGVDPDMETDELVLRMRTGLERSMEHVLRDRIGLLPHDARALLCQMASSDTGPSLSKRFELSGTLHQMRELAIHRSAYQLKEADPHSWAIPRLAGRAKSALVRIQFDEYGNGDLGAAHCDLFAATMRSLDLDDSYGAYIDLLPGVTLATGNLIGLLGASRRLLPALLGHLALFEMCSVAPMQRYARTLERLGISAAGRRFYDVHVIADAEHEVIALEDLVGGYLEDLPDSQRRAAEREVCFGALALDHVESLFASHLTDAFDRGRSSLLGPAQATARSAMARSA